MGINRRSFLNRAAIGVAATGLAGAACKSTQSAASPVAPAAAAPAAAPPPVTRASSWEQIRAQFPLSPDYIHMTGMLFASHPAPVQRAIDAYRRELDENPALYLHVQRYGAAQTREVRKQAAAYLDTAPEHFALTDSTTMGLGIVYTGLQLAPGDDILTTTHDHYSTHESLRFNVLRTGASLRKVALYEHGEDASVEGMVQAITKAIRPSTRVVAVTWVHSSTGVKVPIGAIGKAIAAENARRDAEHQILYCVDGVHGFGIEDVTAADLGCDFFIAGCHKWLHGPRGTGIIWGNERAWKRVIPAIPSFHERPFVSWLEGQPGAQVQGNERMTPGGFHTYEYRWALNEAFLFHMNIGKDRIQQRIHALNTQCKEGLAKMSHVRLHTPMDPAISSGIIAFEVDGLSAEEAAEALIERRVVASSSPYATSYARLTPSLHNTPEEVDAALAAVRALA